MQQVLIRSAPHTFAEWASGGQWVAARHLVYISTRIVQAMSRGRARVIVNLPPRHGKSWLVSKWLPIWYLDNFPTKKVIMCMYGEQGAMEWGTAVRDEFETNPLLYTRLRPDIRAKTYWKTDQGGSMLSAGIGGPIMGKGFDCLYGKSSIRTERGPVNIEDLWNMADAPRVLSFNHATGKQEFKKIVGGRQTTSSKLVEVRSRGGKSIICTEDHRIHNFGPRYVEAGSLQRGMRLSSSVQEYDLVDSVDPLKRSEYVFDIEVEDNHNFYSDSILCHNCGIIDDPIKSREEADSPIVLQSIKNWFDTTFYSRREPGAHIIILMHRWSTEDLTGYLVREHKDPWEVIELPALAGIDDVRFETPDTAALKARWPGDPIGRKWGEALWPERLPAEEFSNVERVTFLSLYQQRPPSEKLGRVYYNYSDLLHIDQGGEDTKLRFDMPLDFTLDFNVNPGMHALLGQYIKGSTDLITYRHLIHDYRLKTRGVLERFGKILQDTCGMGWNDGKGGFKFPLLRIFGDRSGRTEQSSTVETDYQQIEAWLIKNQIPYTMCVPKANPPIKFRVETVNDALLDLDNQPHIKVHKDCKQLIRDFAQQPTGPDGLPDKETDDTMGHAGDACGYHLVWIRPVRRIKFKPRRQVSVERRK